MRILGYQAKRRYKKNLRVNNYNQVISYNTHVATINGKMLEVHVEKTSPTTTKHINYVAENFGLTKKLSLKARA